MPKINLQNSLPIFNDFAALKQAKKLIKFNGAIHFYQVVILRSINSQKRAYLHVFMTTIKTLKSFYLFNICRATFAYFSALLLFLHTLA
jgi:hypothetical protein